MRRRMHIPYILVLSIGWLLPHGCWAQAAVANAQPITTDVVQQSVDKATPKKKRRGKKRKKFFYYKYNGTKLLTIVQDVEEISRKSIIYPTDAQGITAVMTIDNDEKLTPEQAWELLPTYLAVAGYSIVPHGYHFVIRKNEANVLQDAFPIYIGVPIDELPDNDHIITYLYRLENIRLAPGNTPGAQRNELEKIVQDMIVDKAKPGTARVLLDNQTNALIVTGRAYAIKTAMQVVAELDRSGYREVVEMIKLSHVNAAFTAKFLREQLLTIATAEDKIRKPLTMQVSDEDKHIFTRNTKIIEEPRTNSLIILGREQTVERLKKFIYEYIDIPLESGESIVHIYDLQYLDARTFAEDLDTILKSGKTAAGQSRGQAEQQRFQDVIVMAEEQVKKEGIKAGEVAAEGITLGGNRLIIAATKRDWKHIRRFIRSIDKPQPQVALEVLIVDVTLFKNKALGAQMRTKDMELFKELQYQSAHIESPILETPTPMSLVTDLLRLDEPSKNLATRTTAGSTVISFGDETTNGIWLLLQMLNRYTDTKVLSHPHVVTLNHQEARFLVSESRLVTGPRVESNNVATVQQERIDAKLAVTIKPRINLTNSINLQIIVDVQDFIDRQEGDNSRLTRQVITNATVGNGEILILGGLVRTRERNSTRKTPLLGSLPVIGNLFKKRDNETQKDNLLIFISPTVVKPKRGGGMNHPTQVKFDYAQEQIGDQDLFTKLKDPISRWFFGTGGYDEATLAQTYRDRELFVTKEIEELEAQVDPALQKEVRVYEEVDGTMVEHTEGQDIAGVRKTKTESMDEEEDDDEESEPEQDARLERIRRMAADIDNPLVAPAA